MRSSRLLSVLLLSSLCAMASDNAPRMVSDLPPEAQATVRAAMKRRFPGHSANGQSGPGRLVPQVAKLTAPGYYVGGSVAISGGTVAVGDPLGGNFQGAVYVYTKPASGWKNMSQVATLTASDGQTNPGLGCSVAISDDTIVAGVATPEYDGCYLQIPQSKGGIYVFVKPPGGWTSMTETAKLTPLNPEPDEIGIGWSVATNGETIVGGAPGVYGSPSPGAAYVFTKPANGWHNMSQTAKLTASDGMAGDELGFSMAMANGTIVAGAPGRSRAYVYVEPSGGWTNETQTAEFIPSDSQAPDSYGFGFAAAAAGNSVVVGDPYANGGEGAAYVFVEPASGWANMTETAALTAASGGNLGSSLAMEAEAVVAGGPYFSNGINDREGAAFIFLKPKDGWKNTANYESRLTGSDTRIVTFFGTSVGVSGDTIVSGAPWAVLDTFRQGAAYLYELIP